MAKPKASIPTIHANHLALDIRNAIARVKTRLKSSLPREVFHNKQHQLPRPDQGCQYRKIQVGAAHPGDTRGAGKRRLILEINLKSREIREIYFSDTHYQAGSFRRILS